MAIHEFTNDMFRWTKTTKSHTVTVHKCFIIDYDKFSTNRIHPMEF